MFIIVHIIWLSCCSASLVGASVLKVSVYYEALCPDSIRFITTQFYSTFKDLENYLDVDLIPFGKAKASHKSGHWIFHCQHGPQECYGNKVHSCVLEFYSKPISLDFVNCAMAFETPDSNVSFKVCANKTDIPWDFINNCVNSSMADQLLNENGKRTQSVSPPISFIPTIIFNNTYNEKLQNEAQKHFLKVVCDLLENEPDLCKYFDISLINIY